VRHRHRGLGALRVFGARTHDDYSDQKAYSQEGLLDVLAHAGFEVLWRDNNSGCKGVCDRVAYEDLSQANGGRPDVRRRRML
jgi:lipid A ethanolaminephosphotransferase